MGSCDNRCTSGKEGTCRCSCGGDNHGTAKAAYDTIQGGGQATVKGAGIELLVTKGDNGEIVGHNQYGTKVGTYKSEDEFVKELGELIRAGRVEVATKDLNDKTKVIVEPKLTDKEAQKLIREAGATVSRKDGEYRVNIPGGTEATAYYTDDPRDAVGTARAMMKIGAPQGRELAAVERVVERREAKRSSEENHRPDLPFHLQYREEDFIPRVVEPTTKSDKVKAVLVGEHGVLAIHRDRSGYGTIAHQLPHEALPVHEKFSDNTTAARASFHVRERIAADIRKANPKIRVELVRPGENSQDRIREFEKKYSRRNVSVVDEKTGRTHTLHPKIE